MDSGHIDNEAEADVRLQNSLVCLVAVNSKSARTRGRAQGRDAHVGGGYHLYVGGDLVFGYNHESAKRPMSL